MQSRDAYPGCSSSRRIVKRARPRLSGSAGRNGRASPVVSCHRRRGSHKPYILTGRRCHGHWTLVAGRTRVPYAMRSACTPLLRSRRHGRSRAGPRGSSWAGERPERTRRARKPAARRRLCRDAPSVARPSGHLAAVRPKSVPCLAPWNRKPSSTGAGPSGAARSSTPTTDALSPFAVHATASYPTVLHLRAAEPPRAVT
jgi:hypothetical protein